MDIAMIGLGKMGADMATRMPGKGDRVAAFDVREETMRNRFGGHAVKGAK